MDDTIHDKEWPEEKRQMPEPKNEMAAMLKQQMSENAKLQVELRRLSAEVAAMKGLLPKE